jgi:hypothetical protein
MTIYLYVKTHRKTGLKYLGKTESADPHKYRGSGIFWTRHIKKYGYDVDTEIIRECKDADELRHWGLYYSTLWNVVESDKWANLKEETGHGGRHCAEVRERISEAGKGRVPWNKDKQVWDDIDKNGLVNQTEPGAHSLMKPLPNEWQKILEKFDQMCNENGCLMHKKVGN